MDGKRLKFILEKSLPANWLVLVFVLVFLLRLPSLFEPFTYGDEGVYLTLGQALRRGLVWYRDIHDNKPPMLYLLAAIAGNFDYFRLLLFVWSFVTIFLFYKLSQLLFKNNKLPIIISTSLFAILTSSHTFEGNVANAENFMLLPTIAAFYLLLKVILKRDYSVPKIKQISYFGVILTLAGILFGLAALFKIPAAFDFGAGLVFVFLVFSVTKKKNYKSLIPKAFRRNPAKRASLEAGITNSVLLLLGFVFPILLTLAYYASKGAFVQYLTAAFFQNIPYLASWGSGQTQVGGLPLSLLGRSLAVFFLVIILIILKKRVSLIAQLVLVWFAFSWFAALLSSRPYPHYLIQILPAFSLSFGLFFTQQKRFLKEKIIPIAYLVTFIATFATFQFWHYKNLPYYLNFYQYALGIKNQQKYFSDFDPQTNKIYQIAKYLRTHTLPEEKIFIWGNDPFIYALSRRLPVGRYSVAYHIVGFNGYEKTIQALNDNPPRFLIVSGTEKRPFPDLTSLIQNNYLPATEINGAQIFYRNVKIRTSLREDLVSHKFEMGKK